MKSIPIFIANIISESTMDIIFRSDNRLLWQKVLDNLSYIPVDYMHEVLDFQLAYESSFGVDISDISMIIEYNNKPCVVWPLFFKFIDNVPYFRTTSTSILSPLFTVDTPKSVRKFLSKELILIFEKICKSTGVNSFTIDEIFQNKKEVSDWHYEMIRFGAIPLVRYDLFIDLSLDITDIKSRFRKSYKSLINKGLKLWKVEVLNHSDQNIWNEFKELHLRVAGRITRSDDTWKLHLRYIEMGKAFLVCLRDFNGNLVGGGFFLYSSTECFYSVGVYDRSLFSEPLGHIVQFVAIEEMKKLNIPWYKLGVRNFQNYIPKPTDKEISISEFKEGFASLVAHRYSLTYNIDLSNNTSLNVQ
jgi:FemAB family protein